MSHGVTDQAAATHTAIVAVALKVRKQANIMAFSDAFYVLGIALSIALVASMLLKKPDRLSGGGGH
jgi:DHA2 family multidrug resistance protein